MPGFKLVATLVVGALTLVLVGLCLVDQGPLMSHLEDPELCCGFAQCSVMAVGVFALGLWMAFTPLLLARAVPVRSAIQLPITPPPEPNVLAA
jgi:hypothetical protein